MSLLNAPILLLLATVAVHADAGTLANPYMFPVTINKHICIQQNKRDCIQSICIASPHSCHSQCTVNAQNKCAALARQQVYP